MFWQGESSRDAIFHRTRLTPLGNDLQPDVQKASYRHEIDFA
jgi:hypothetical protein